MNASNHSFVNIQNIEYGENYQYPNNLLNPAFGELNLIKKAESIEIVLTILMTPVKEGSQTGVALDGSASMQASFGQGWMYSESYDQSVMERLRLEGKLSEILQDGQTLLQPTPDGWQELQEKGFVKQTNNELAPIARDVIPYLAEKIDADGGTSLIYWACGPNGDQIEEVGDLSSSAAEVADYNGPNAWGLQTHLLPALRYFVERFSDAKWGFYVFVTDGRIEDLEAVKQYTADISKKIGRKEANPVNCVLIGVGSEVDESQMAQLDDLPRELNLPIDIWDHKIAKEMRDLRDIFAEVVDENTMVAPNGRILDGNGNTAASFADGVPALLKFSLPLTSTSFTLEVGLNKIQQKLFL
jgi:hypothetical protein